MYNTRRVYPGPNPRDLGASINQGQVTVPNGNIILSPQESRVIRDGRAEYIPQETPAIYEEISGFLDIELKDYDHQTVEQSRVPELERGIPDEEITGDIVHAAQTSAMINTPFSDIYSYYNHNNQYVSNMSPGRIAVRQANLEVLFKERFIFLLNSALEEALTIGNMYEIDPRAYVRLFEQSSHYSILLDIRAYIASGSPLMDIGTSYEILQTFITEVYNGITLHHAYSGSSIGLHREASNICYKLSHVLYSMMNRVLEELREVYLPAGGIDYRELE